MILPQLTALMTTYNVDRFVADTIQSVLAQTYPHFELLILDDGSTDKTCEIIKSFKDSRIRLYEYPDNEGVGFRLGQALEFINTPYIVKVDADDISLSNRFQTQLEYLAANPEVGLVKCYVDYFADNEAVLKSQRFCFIKNNKESEINAIATSSQIKEQLKRWLCIPHTTYMAKTEAIKNAGYSPTRMYEDYSLFYTLLKQNCTFGCVPEKLVKMRISEYSTTASPGSHEIDMGVEVIVNFKWPEISILCRNRDLFIYGSGQLAKSLSRVLHKKGVSVIGFIERRKNQLDMVSIDGVPIWFVEDGLPEKESAAVIIAAQPVRSEISQLFFENGWEEWINFMVIA